MSITASIIIPTHNRSASLKKMLENFASQTFSSQDFEVIVAADGCKDDTVQMVKNFKANYSLRLCELPGSGAATARNEGASRASGNLLIFVDDDMELSPDFIAQHIAAHLNENTVAIGYSPFKLESKASIQRISLRDWWEEKFQEMRRRDHRFKYDDLTSGNFSISTSLFKKVKGFDTSLLCREDYEFGYRLIKAGAEFCFAYNAKALHRDEVTNLKRSLQRKKSEGMADIQIKKLHPEYSNKEATFYLSQRSTSKKFLLKAIQFFPSLFDAFANLGTSMTGRFEKLKMRNSWMSMNYRLHQYWYLRGLMKAVPSSTELYHLISNPGVAIREDQKLRIDLLQGLVEAEKEMDRLRPLALDIYYEEKFLGTISPEAGVEPLKGIHLRRILKDYFSDELYSVLKPSLFKQKN